MSAKVYARNLYAYHLETIPVGATHSTGNLGLTDKEWTIQAPSLTGTRGNARADDPHSEGIGKGGIRRSRRRQDVPYTGKRKRTLILPGRFASILSDLTTSR